MKSGGVRIYVDSIIGGTCRLLVGEEARMLTMPLEYLPDGTEEGDALRMTFTECPEETAAAKDDVEALLASLGNDI